MGVWSRGELRRVPPRLPLGLLLRCLLCGRFCRAIRCAPSVYVAAFKCVLGVEAPCGHWRARSRVVVPAPSRLRLSSQHLYQAPPFSPAPATCKPCRGQPPPSLPTPHTHTHQLQAPLRLPARFAACRRRTAACHSRQRSLKIAAALPGARQVRRVPCISIVAPMAPLFSGCTLIISSGLAVLVQMNLGRRVGFLQIGLTV